MGKSRKVPLIPPATLPDSAEDAAKLKLAVEQQARAMRCLTEIKASLVKHRCTIVAQTIIHFDGRSPSFQWDVGAQ
jgi:hypothetical protein